MQFGAELGEKIVECIFEIALFINAGLFVSQAIRIYKSKYSKGVSLITFFGFLLIQLTVVLHGILHKDNLLVIGYALSMVACASVIALTLYYRKFNESENSKDSLPVEQYEILENIIALTPGHVYWLDRDCVYLGCNDNQARSAGLSSRKEIVGKRNIDLPWNSNTDILPSMLDKVNLEVMETGKAICIEEFANLKDSTQGMFLSNKVPIRNKVGEVVGMVGISIDITERKKNEKELLLEKTKAEEASKAKDEFLKNMRHDIRTSLTGVIGLADLMQNEDDISKMKYYTASLGKASKELLNFLNEILESINVTSGEIPIIKNKFSIHKTIEKIINLHLPKALEKDLSLKFDVDAKIPTYLIGDSVRAYRIFLELLVNSLKFTSQGYVKLSVQLAKKEERNLILKIVVEDTGIGIPEDKQKELFVRFKRLSYSYQGIYKGAGLGLSIVKQFVDDLEGEIYVESIPNQGCKFICLLPFKEPLLEGSQGAES